MKKIKLPLEMANGVLVRTLDELKENWDLEKVINYYLNGKLQTWLTDRYYTELADKVSALSDINDNTELQKNLCDIFGMEFKADTEFVDIDAVAEQNRKVDILRKYTADDKLLKNTAIKLANVEITFSSRYCGIGIKEPGYFIPSCSYPFI